MQDLFGRIVSGVTYVAVTVILILMAGAVIVFLVCLIGKILAW